MKKLWIALIVVVLAIIAVFLLRTNTETYEAPTTSPTDTNTGSAAGTIPLNDETQTPPTPPVEEEPESSGISASELAAHNSETDCWVVFEGRVYDLTDWIPKHPGGRARIANTCGDETKFEEDFLRQHKRSRVSMLMDVGVFMGDFDVVGSFG